MLQDQPEQRSGKAARSGRSRRAILSAARERFARDGYARTTVRAVAADAGIDPSMVMRYFGSKQGLFTAAADLDLALPELTQVPRDQLGAAAVRHFLARWEGEQTTDSLRVLLTTAVTDQAAAAQMQQIFRAQLQPVVAAAGHDPASAAVRSGLIATQILGLALCRYVLQLPPVVALEPEAVVRWLGPVIQTYLLRPEEVEATFVVGQGFCSARRRRCGSE